jgi:hypothetical protein
MNVIELLNILVMNQYVCNNCEPTKPSEKIL